MPRPFILPGSAQQGMAGAGVPVPPGQGALPVVLPNVGIPQGPAFAQAAMQPAAPPPTGAQQIAAQFGQALIDRAQQFQPVLPMEEAMPAGQPAGAIPPGEPGPEAPAEGAHPLVQQMMGHRMDLDRAQAAAVQPLAPNTRMDPYGMARSGIVKMVGSIIAQKSGANLVDAEADFTRFLHEEVGPNPTWEAIHDFQAKHGITDEMLPESVRALANHDIQIREISAKHNADVLRDYRRIQGQQAANIEELQVQEALERETLAFKHDLGEVTANNASVREAERIILQGDVDMTVDRAAKHTAWKLENLDRRIDSLLRRNFPEGAAAFDRMRASTKGGLVDPVGALAAAGEQAGFFQGVQSMSGEQGSAVVPAELTVKDRFPERAPGRPANYPGIFSLYAHGTGPAAGAARAEFDSALDQMAMQQGLPPAADTQRRLNAIGETLAAEFGEDGIQQFGLVVDELAAMRQFPQQSDEDLRALGVPRQQWDFWRQPTVDQMRWWKNQMDRMQSGDITELDWDEGSQRGDRSVSRFVGPPAPGAGGAPAPANTATTAAAPAQGQASQDTIQQANQWVESAGGRAGVEAMLNDPSIAESQKQMIRQVLQMTAR